MTRSQLAAFGVRREFASGQRIIQRGETGRDMYVIGSGHVRLEFAVVFTRDANPAERPAIARLCDALHAPEGPCVRHGVSASFGFARYESHDWIDWYQAADTQLYRAKQNGGRALATEGQALRSCA